MKKVPDLKDLSAVETSDKFSQKVAEVKADIGKTQPKTYSLVKKDIDYISSIALKLGQKEGKPVSASKALALIIAGHKAAKKGAKL